MQLNLIGEMSSAVVGFIFAQYLIPVTQKIADSIKTNKGFVGNFYKTYYNNLGKHFLFKKLDPTLKGRDWEYKIFIENNKATCYCSKITDLRQNHFNVINGKIERIGQNENNEIFFRGSISGNQFQWTETNNQKENKNIIHALYNTDRNPDNIVGSSVEVSNRIITTPICILSRESIMHNTLEQLIEEIPELKSKLNNIELHSPIIT